MQNRVDVSVIVPVYNVEEYLHKCLDSLILQELKNIEIIIVNDGSTDASQDIIDWYVRHYPNKIICYQKQNSGLGDARNYGIEKANGDFIGFVDSDDWVNPNMFKAMLEKAKQGFDVVICDFMVIQDGSEKGYISKGFRGGEFNKKEVLKNSLNPATACNKLYSRKLFEIIKFSSEWYEDMGTTPIYLSYANRIGYLEVPFYYYRQRKSSITHSLDFRTLGVINAWERVLEYVNKQYLPEIEFAIYQSIVAFMDFKPEFSDDFLKFAQEKKKIFLENNYLKNEKLFLLNKQLIPKKIHYFWFGGNEKNELINKCIQSWKIYAPGYEIVEWNEANCDIEENEYVREAYRAGKWAFVADYFRIKVIYHEGGIYLDTDTELTKRIDVLRDNQAFFAFETKTAIHAGILGAIPGHPLIKMWLETYKNERFLDKNGKPLSSFTIVKRLTNILYEKYDVKFNGRTQLLKDGIRIYSPNILTIDVYDGENIAIHHYEASWWDTKESVSYKNVVLKDYFDTNPFKFEYQMEFLRKSYRNLKYIADNERSIRSKLIYFIIVPIYKIYKLFKSSSNNKEMN